MAKGEIPGHLASWPSDAAGVDSTPSPPTPPESRTFCIEKEDGVHIGQKKDKREQVLASGSDAQIGEHQAPGMLLGRETRLPGSHGSVASAQSCQSCH